MAQWLKQEKRSLMIQIHKIWEDDKTGELSVESDLRLAHEKDVAAWLLVQEKNTLTESEGREGEREK